MPASASASTKTTKPAHKRVPHHFTALLIAELAFILGYPFVVEMALHDELFRLLAVLIFCASLYAVLGERAHHPVRVHFGRPRDPHPRGQCVWLSAPWQVASLALGVVFLAYVTTVFIWAIVKNPSVTADTLAGAVSAYMLLGITYGLAYGMIEQLQPGSFRDTVQPGKHFAPSELTFFSFVTLTTVGYGDIIPWGSHARSLAILEAVTGIMYPAVLIGRLVGLHGRKHEEP